MIEKLEVDSTKEKSGGQIAAVVQREEEDDLSQESESMCEKDEIFKNVKGVLEGRED